MAELVQEEKRNGNGWHGPGENSLDETETRQPMIQKMKMIE